ncbi:MAG: hypothetical protein WAW88_06080 [Nocardioides sp.]
MDKSDNSIAVLRQLHELGAINLDVLVHEAGKVREVISANGYDPEWDICYKFTVHIGPRFFDLTEVAEEIRGLGYEMNRIG